MPPVGCRALLAACAAAVLAGAPACGGGGSAQTTAELGKPAPAYQGKTLAGEYVALADYKGKVVLLNVWATWCGPCRKELPELVALQAKHEADGFTVLGVSVDTPGARGRLEAMVAEFGLSYPIVHDPDGRGLSGLRIRGYPTSFLIDREGLIRWRRDGIIEPGEGELAAQIHTALHAQ